MSNSQATVKFGIENNKTELKNEENKKKEEKSNFHVKIEEKLKKISEDEKEILMRKSIEDVINRWKNDLDKQVEKFNDLCERLGKFEEQFQNNFDNVSIYILYIYLYLYIYYILNELY
jgi:hypothetical protein